MRISDWSSDVCSSDLLGHLGATEIEHAVVQPVTRKHLAVMGAGALRDLVFVMRKLQVDAAGMNVDGLAQVRFAHRRTFDVQTWATTAPRSVPTRKLAAGWPPQHDLPRKQAHRRVGESLVRSSSSRVMVYTYQ